MPDIFDEISPDTKGDIFDQIEHERTQQLEADWEKQFPPEPAPGFFKSAARGIDESLKATAGGVQLPLATEDELAEHLQTEMAKLQREEPPKMAGKAGAIAGSLVGTVGQALATSRLGRAGLAAQFASQGAYDAFMHAGMRALAEGKDVKDAVKIGRTAAGAGAVVGGTIGAIFKGNVGGGWREAARESLKMGAAGAGGRAVQNVVEQQLGLKTPISEGVIQQGAIMGALPAAGFALPRVARLPGELRNWYEGNVNAVREVPMPPQAGPEVPIDAEVVPPVGLLRDVPRQLGAPPPEPSPRPPTLLDIEEQLRNLPKAEKPAEAPSEPVIEPEVVESPPAKQPELPAREPVETEVEYAGGEMPRSTELAERPIPERPRTSEPLPVAAPVQTSVPTPVPSPTAAFQENESVTSTTPKEQKAYLLEHLDDAIKASPDVLAERKPNDADADLLRVSERLKEQSPSLAHMEDLLTKYSVKPPYAVEHKVLTGQTERHEWTEGAALNQLESRIKEAIRNSRDHVVIKVPGDGTFAVPNRKADLVEFREKVRKRFPATTSKPEQYSPRKLPSPTAVQKVVKQPTQEDNISAAELAVSTDANRGQIQSAYSNGKELIGTDGRRLVRIIGNVPGTLENPVLIKGGKISKAELEEGKTTLFANYKQVIPQDRVLVSGGVDIGKLANSLKQAEILQKDTRTNSFKLYRNPDGSLGIGAHSVDVGEMSHNVQPNAAYIATYSLEYFPDVINIARKLGNERVDVYVDAHGVGERNLGIDLAPIIITGKNFEYVLMPMREEGKSFSKGALTYKDLPVKGDKPIHPKLPAPIGPKEVQVESTPKTKKKGKGIAASARNKPAQPSGEAGFVTLEPLRVVKAAKDVVIGTLDYYSEPLTDRLAREGGQMSKGFANMSREIIQRSKALFGSLSPTLDPALEATGRLNKATTWLNDIAPTNRKWGYRNAVAAVEGPIANVPAFARQTVNLLKAANLDIGRLPQSVVPGFIATGKYQRTPTAFLVDTIRSGKGEAHDLLVQALSVENRIPSTRVRTILSEMKAEMDSPGSQQTVHRIAQEFERHFPKFPTDLRIQTGFGEIWMPILHAKPFEYLTQAALSTSQRVAFLERMPQGTLGPIRTQIVRELKTPDAFDDLVRALHGLPVNQPLRMFAPGSPQAMVAAGINRILGDVFSSMKLTVSAIYNIGETVLGGVPQTFGWKRTLQGAMTLAQRHANLEALGAINRAFYNWSYDPSSPVRSVMADWRQLLRKGTAQQFFNELQEKLAASTAQVFAEQAQGGILSSHQQALFTEAATAMGFQRTVAEQMAAGSGAPEQYNDFIRRSAAYTTGGNIQGGETSRFGGNRVMSALFRFQSYPIMKLNASRKVWTQFFEAVGSNDPSRIKASSELLAKWLFGTIAQGAAAAFLAALFTGRGGGVKESVEDAKEHPAKFVMDSIAGGMGGPVSALNYVIGSGHPSDLLDIRKINPSITFPGSVYMELMEMFRRKGPYAGMTLSGAANKYLQSKVPVGKAIRYALEQAGIVHGDKPMTNDVYRWLRKWGKESTDPKVQEWFKNFEAYSNVTESKYAGLTDALRKEDWPRAKVEYETLRKTTKPLTIVDYYMRPANRFTSSIELERKFKATLTAEELKEYQAALKERRSLGSKFTAFRKTLTPRP